MVCTWFEANFGNRPGMQFGILHGGTRGASRGILFIVVDLGVGRLMLRAQGASDHGAYLILQSKYLKARASELEQIQVSAEQARAADHISDKPLIVLTAAENTDTMLRSGLSQRDFEEFQRIWVDDLQMRLAGLCTRATRHGTGKWPRHSFRSSGVDCERGA